MEFKFFPSFFEHPPKIRFSEQEQNEIVELFLRQHPIVNVPWVIIALTAIFVPVILIQLDQLTKINVLSTIPTQTLIGALVVFYLLILGYVIESFLHWYFNIYIITNLHIVDINFDSLLFRDITEISLQDIESVATSISGIFGSLFNFGDVDIETAAKTQAASFNRVPKPDLVADRIEDLRRGTHTGP